MLSLINAHNIRSYEDEPGDDIHVPEDMEGLLIWPKPTGYKTVPGIIRDYALQCEQDSEIVDILHGSENWMQKHIYAQVTALPLILSKSTSVSA